MHIFSFSEERVGKPTPHEKPTNLTANQETASAAPLSFRQIPVMAEVRVLCIKFFRSVFLRKGNSN